MLWSVHSFCVVLLKEYNLLPLEHTDIHYAQSLVYCFLSQPQLTAQYSCAHPAAFFWLILVPAPFCISCPLHCCCFLLLQTFASCCAAFSFYRLTCSSAAPAAHQMQALLSNVRTSVKPIVFTTLFIDSVQAALLEGVFCPGIGQTASGSILLDTAATTLQVRIRRLFALAPADSQPLAFAPHVQDCNGSVMAAWHLYNADTPTWLSLSGLLTDPRSRVSFCYFCTRAGQRFFIAHLLIETLRFALVFSTWTRCRDPPRLTC